jgi:hypothetical protein
VGSEEHAKARNARIDVADHDAPPRHLVVISGLVG